ncbi:hypothetical protein [Sphingomonas sp.]|uniref:hypothetical protein n=1 Tax=Sphingomonas sp. TaxID=28214 RepID=UPI0035617B3E
MNSALITMPATRHARPTRLPPVAFSLAIAVAMAYVTAPMVTVDMAVYLIPWFDHIAASGAITVFAHPFSNYTPLYLYLLAAITPLGGLVPQVVLIKLLSLLGTAALAFAVRAVLVRLGAPQANRGAALVAVLPSVMLNAGLMGQCDAMWAAACIMALAAALDRRHAAMLAWCGLALGFKAQSVFVAPFFLALLVNRHVPLRLWLIAPLVTVATILPAWMAGWPASDLALVYLRQADYFQALSMNAPNIWAIVQRLPLDGLPLAGLAFAAAIGVGGAYVARISTLRLDGRALVAAAALAPLLMVGLLPRMHERFFFLTDIVTLIVALANRDRASWRIALLVQAGSSLGLLGYLIGWDGFAVVGAVPMLVATVSLARIVVKPAANDNPLMARPPLRT